MATRTTLQARRHPLDLRKISKTPTKQRFSHYGRAVTGRAAVRCNATKLPRTFATTPRSYGAVRLATARPLCNMLKTSSIRPSSLLCARTLCWTPGVQRGEDTLHVQDTNSSAV